MPRDIGLEAGALWVLSNHRQGHLMIPFDPTIFNADFKPPAAALVEKSWRTNEHSFWLRITQHGRVYADIHPAAALVGRNFEKCD